jgi:UDP-glucose:(heptosyl)LPS alpha-1,3-glucosyltransferase
VRHALPRHRVLLGLERGYFRSRPKAVVAVSRQTARELVELYEVDPALITTIPNGYAAGEFSAEAARATRPGRRAELGLTDDDVVLLLVANELHRKGLKTLLEATALLADPRVQVHVVGRAPLDPYRPLIERLRLGDRVRWHGPSRDVASWYAVGDLFVMPTQYEAFPLVVVEALASGLPVITTAVAGSAEAVIPDTNGLLQHDPDDAEELAELLRCGLDPDRRAAWAAAAPATVVDLEWSKLAERFAGVLDRVVAG